MPRIGISQGPQQRITLLQRAPFTISCLPLMVELAHLFRREIEPSLHPDYRRWPFDDRVLVWLMPVFLSDAVAYHEDHGPPMVELYRSYHLTDFDRWCLERLCRALEHVCPGTLTKLSRAPLGPRSQWMRIKQRPRRYWRRSDS
jgi:hypothetical protein